MRIRRNQWLPCILAITIPLLASANLQAQETSGTANAAPITDSTTGSASGFKLEPGDQLIYQTDGILEMTGNGQQQNENMDIVTSITVLEKKSDILTLYAAVATSEETTAGKTYTPGPRYTFELPVAGVEPDQELEKAGVAGAAFPTFSVETLFAKPQPEGKTTFTTYLPVTNAPVQGDAITNREGTNLVTLSTVSEESTPILTRKAMFDTAKGLVQTLETSVTMPLSSRGVTVVFNINDKTSLINSTKLSDSDLAGLKADLAAAVPLATKLSNLQMSPPNVVAAVIAEMRKNLEDRPNGEFSALFARLQEQIDTGGGASRGPNAVNLKKGQPIPDFSTTTVDNKPFKLSDLKGKVVLLDFWATWCPPCIIQLPHLKELYNTHKEDNFALIGISADENVEDLKTFLETEDIQWTQIFDGGDTTSTIAEQYGIFIRPTTVLIDSKGNVSEIDLYGKTLEAAVEKLLKEAK